MPRLKGELLRTPRRWIWLSKAEALSLRFYTLESNALCFPKPRLLISVFSLSQRVHAGEGDHSELRSPLSPVLCSLVLPCSLPFAILRSSQKVALPASATGSGRACFPQRPPIPFGRRLNPNQPDFWVDKLQQYIRDLRPRQEIATFGSLV